MICTITHATLDGNLIRLRNTTDGEKVLAIASDMAERGWAGRPVIVYNDGHRLRNITGCHRIDAALQAGIRVSALLIETDDDDVLDMLDAAARSDNYDAAYLLNRINPELGAVAREEITE